MPRPMDKDEQVEGLKEEETSLPRHEADGFDDGRLDDLLAREDAPRYGIGTVRVRVSTQIAALVDHVVCDVAVAFNVRQQERKQRRVDEEFQVCLENKSARE
jgi:hypothetical protein